MDSLQTLLAKAKAELNHIYTEPPAFRNGGRDEGWFCREHAMHSYFLLRLFGASNPRIEIGHFTLRLPDEIITSHESGADHAWCATEAHRPIDLSISFRYYDGCPPLTAPIIGEGANAAYQIQYFDDEATFLSAAEERCPAVYYHPQKRLFDPDSLLEHPQAFLFDSGPESWLQSYGAEVFARITLHAYKVAMSQVNTLTRLSPQEAFSRIRSRYSAARPKIRNLLKQAKDVSDRNNGH